MDKEQTGTWNLKASDWARIRREANMASRKAYGLIIVHVAWAVNKVGENQDPLTNPYKGKSEELKMYGYLDKLGIYRNGKKI